ncbi:MAG TPA: hypothetical protein VK658_06140 [Chryseolinea sp.]|nr:hypothetical protein [Chryseolinea sp.]
MRFALAFFITSLALAAHGQDVRLEPGPFMELVASSKSASVNEGSITHEPSGIHSTQREMYKIPQEPGIRMMKVGKVLTGVGAGIVIAGILVYNNRDPDYYTQSTYGGVTYGDDPHEVGGQMLVGIGVGMIVPGVMVWIHGASKFHKHQEKMEKNAQGLYVPAGKLGLGYRF